MLYDRREIVASVEDCIPGKLINTTVDLVGARLGYHGDYRFALAVLGGKGRAQQVGLLQSIDVRLDRHVVELDGTNICLVKHIVRRRSTAAVYRDVKITRAVLTWRSGLTSAAVAKYPEPVSQAEARYGHSRQIVDLLLVDNLANRRLLRLQLRRQCADLDRISHRTDGTA